jgi:hypothetical protein
VSRKKLKGRPRRKGPRRTGIAIGVAVLLFLVASILANRGYNFRQHQRGGGSVSPQSLNPASPSKEYIYAGGRMLASEEPVPPMPPTGLTARTLSTASVTLNWTAPSPAPDHYVVERSSSFAGTYTQLGQATATTYTDPSAGQVPPGPSPGVAYIYRVRSADSSGNTSSPSNLALATTVMFTDEPLHQFATTVKAVHITDLRTAVNAVRTTAGLAGYVWTNQTLTPQVTQVKAVDVEDLRNALTPALTTMGFSAPVYTDEPLHQMVTRIKAQHIQELRQLVNGVF